MNDQYFGNSINNPDNVEEKNMDTNSPVENLGPYTGQVPPADDAAHNEEINVEGTIAGVGPMEEPLAGDVPLGGSVVDNRPLYEETIVAEAPMVGNTARQAPAGTALFNHEESEQFRTRWNEIQGKFVDDPRSAVQQADTLLGC